jgi:hypothetical protein
MKFKTVEDKYSFLVEIKRLELFEKVNDDYTPDDKLLELFFNKEQSLFKQLKDKKKSRSMESAWRHHRYKFMKGIGTFHKSTKGKRFHRELGRFIATHSFDKGFLFSKSESFHKVYSYLKPVTSILTYFIIDLEYYHPLPESVDLHLTFTDTALLVDRMKEHFLLRKDIDEDDYDFLIRLTETNAQINAFAEKSGKSKETVEKMWNEIKKSLIDDGKKETDPRFFGLLVSILKKKLK